LLLCSDGLTSFVSQEELCEALGNTALSEREIINTLFDRVYENYNDIQLKAGLDLRPYMGMKGVRYTYIVENYPKDVGEEVRANVICINNEPVGGDIMTVSIRGFIHSLNFDDSLR